jgi:hypothetical protein
MLEIMKANSYRRVLKIVIIILAITLFATNFNTISDFYLKRPTIAILLFIASIIFIYLIVFFKEIFFRQKSNRNSH